MVLAHGPITPTLNDKVEPTPNSNQQDSVRNRERERDSQFSQSSGKKNQIKTEIKRKTEIVITIRETDTPIAILHIYHASHVRLFQS